MPVKKNPTTRKRPNFKLVPCQRCGKDMELVVKSKKYCSNSCRVIAWAIRKGVYGAANSTVQPL